MLMIEMGVWRKSGGWFCRQMAADQRRKKALVAEMAQTTQLATSPWFLFFALETTPTANNIVS